MRNARALARKRSSSLTTIPIFENGRVRSQQNKLGFSLMAVTIASSPVSCLRNCVATMFYASRDPSQMRECLEAAYRAAASKNLLLATVASNCQTRSVHFSWSVNFQPPCAKSFFNRNNNQTRLPKRTMSAHKRSLVRGNGFAKLR